MGNLKVFFFINNQPLIVIGNKTQSFIIIYHVLIHLTFLLFKYFVMNEVDVGMKYSLSLLYIISVSCHIIIFLFNPGIPSVERYSKIFLKSQNYLKLTEEEQKEYYSCEECNILIKESEKVEHCDECKITIGIDKMSQLENVLQQYHKPHTYLEYYSGKPQLLIEGGKIKE